LKYIEYLHKHKRRRISRKEFNRFLEDEGFAGDRTTKTIDGRVENGWFINGICLKPEFDEKKKEIQEKIDNKDIVDWGK
jgi:hypothetical protein